MNREIKFRAWDKKTEQIFTVEGLNWSSVDKQLQTVYSMSDFGALQNGQNSGDYRRTDEEVELMQYTGLKDKNGVEIYEGDIVVGYPDIVSSASKAPAIVSMWDMSWCAGTEQLSNNDDSIEVIGNIYQNPELLEVGE